MITSMHIENFKCFKDFTIDLGPFNVLIGPNDSGKTAFLEAIRMVRAVGPLRRLGSSRDLLRSTGMAFGPEAVWRGHSHGKVRLRAVASSAKPPTESAMVEITLRGEYVESETLGPNRKPPDNQAAVPGWFEHAVGKVVYYDLDPAALRRPSPLAKEMTPAGEGFPSFLDSINRRDPDIFAAVGEDFRSRFPHYRRPFLDIEKLPGTKDNGLVLRFPSIHGVDLASQAVSDGVMLSLVFMAIARQPDPPSILLVEEPENGVHHASLKDIVGTLKQLSQDKGVQVILTTHSPYLLDEVEMNEVHVFQKDEEGAVHAKLLSEYEGAKEIGGMFGTGEKWSMLSEKFGI